MTLVVLSDLANSSPFSVGASTQVALVIARVRWVFFVSTLPFQSLISDINLKTLEILSLM